MSESESFELIMLMASELSQLLFGYFSIVSAFLVMSYLAADKFNALQTGIILLLYTICSAYIILNIYAINIDLDSLYTEMLSKKESGVYDLAWFGKNPIWIPQSLTIIQIAISLGGYVGSLIFFFAKNKTSPNEIFSGVT